MVNFQQFHMDNVTWEATVGAGTRLGEVTDKMHDAGKRAMAHGVCPDVGTGGHATIVSSHKQKENTLRYQRQANSCLGWPGTNVKNVGVMFGSHP